MAPKPKPSPAKKATKKAAPVKAAPKKVPAAPPPAPEPETTLTDKQSRFVLEYLVDSNATKAAIRAGFSARSAASIAEELMRKPHVAAAIAVAQAKVAEATETDAEWVRRRLKEEADDFSEFSSHSARIKAIELIGKINGVFEKDNKQKVDGLTALAASLGGKVVGVAPGADKPEPGRDED